MARYFRLPFADSGDKDPLPDETANSLVSYATGYSQDYQRNPSSDPLARRMERNFFNQLLFDVTDTLKNLYETGTVPFITSAMNNGSPFSYPLGARVILSNRIYENTTANNTTTPPAAGWVLVDVVGMDDRYLLESNNLSDLTNDDTARTNLSVYSRAETFTRTEQDARYLLEANNLSDLNSAATARTNLGLGTAATVNTGTGSNNVLTTGQADLRYLQESFNLSDLSSLSTARNNLGLGGAATRETAGTGGALPDISNFDRSLGSTSGYIDLPRGVRIVYGTVVINPTSAVIDQTVTLARPFSSGNVFQLVGSINPTNVAQVEQILSVTAATTTSITVRSDNADQGSLVAGFSFLCIGDR